MLLIGRDFKFEYVNGESKRNVEAALIQRAGNARFFVHVPRA